MASQKLFKKRLTIFDLVNYLVMFILAFVCFYPFWNIVVTGFNDSFDTIKGFVYFLPRSPTLLNFKYALASPNIWNAFGITIARTVLGTFLSVITTSMLAYALTKRKLPGYSVMSWYFLITMLFSGGLIPYFLLMKTIHFYNTFWIYIIPGWFGYWNIIIFRSFFDTLPKSIEESAQIDGAGYIEIFFKLIIPMSKPVFATIVLFTAVGHWNDWSTAFFFIESPKLLPVQTLLQRVLTELNVINMVGNMQNGSLNPDAARNLLLNVTPSAVRMAIVVVTATPIILIYPFLQKYFVKGMLLGSVKG